MATRNPTYAAAGRGRLQFKPMLSWHVLVWLVLLALIFYMFAEWRIGENGPPLMKNGGAVKAVGTILFFSAIGYAVGIGTAIRGNDALANLIVSESQERKLAPTPPTYEGYFLIIVWIMIGTYILGYTYAVWKFAHSSGTSEAPVSMPVAAITGITVGALAFFAVRYAAYVRMTRLLEAALIELPKQQHIIDHLRKAVFQGDQLYEPPGNVFVTVGITATFLGLAAALVNLDLPGLLELSNGSENVDPGKAAGALRSFVGCMGLSLGVSMLGVTTAVAAQWLRGHGSRRCTEDLLARALLPYAQIIADAAAADACLAEEERLAGEAAQAQAGRATRGDPAPDAEMA
jgi:hypothetical protein